MNKTLLACDEYGNISYSLSCPDAEAHNQIPRAGHIFIHMLESPPDLRKYKDEHYCRQGKIVPKQTMLCVTPKTDFAADGVAEVIISGIPHAATVRVFGAVTAGPETITDGELIVTSLTPGEIIVSITKSPEYLDWRITLNAT